MTAAQEAPGTSQDCVLNVSGLAVDYHSEPSPVRAVDNVSIDIRRGETVGVVGESGCGKSTLAMAVAGLLSGGGYIAAGAIAFNGRPLRLFDEDDPWRKLRGQRIGMVFQDPATTLNPVMRVGKQVDEVFRSIRKLSHPDARQATIELFGRTKIPNPDRVYRTYPNQLSGGMRQRVSIAMALAGQPDLIVADEPTTALDTTVQRRVLDMFQELSHEFGSAVLLISHDLSLISTYADRVNVMYAGTVVETGTPSRIYSKPAHPYTIGLLGAIPSRAAPGERLVAIPGSPPPLTAGPATGCPFHDRCPLATDLCETQRPQLARVSPAHESACHYWKEVSADGKSIQERLTDRSAVR